MPIIDPHPGAAQFLGQVGLEALGRQVGAADHRFSAAIASKAQPPIRVIPPAGATGPSEGCPSAPHQTAPQNIAVPAAKARPARLRDAAAAIDHQPGGDQREGMPALDHQRIVHRAARRGGEAGRRAMRGPGRKGDGGEPGQRAKEQPETMHGSLEET